ncbi:XrtA/PEP-CTERM system exopolysaccharide export protein [Marinobacter caseinilyticus]|uniref:XrtA/PEP-CTERM system exopolysaccharide export protein n=1 Tax=Marinobacter caseinilyticus TaxID=2692195 RepID=UPI00140E0CE4|nr:XrtA/PEP-CTERM system exopolysaccharide export protein [Marinobacter caseinilyticus]
MSMFNTIRVSLALALSFVLVACSSLGGSGQAPMVGIDKSEPYEIGVGDMVSVHVWRNPDLSQAIVVRPDGYISIPLIGDIKAEGKEPEVLADEIKVGLAQLIRNPDVTVMVTDPVSKEFRNRVRVTGQVMAPQSIAFRPGMTVLDLVLQAGGLTDFAADSRAVLHRETTTGYQSFRIDLDAILDEGNMQSNYMLQPGDIISIPRKQLFRGEL